ncbi:hypothetical protein JTB14_034848 [Gonioctena quinquepunctata]|nr:hypothetical protein JTB14_034848 [Gonioctena quinquepunctata]
MGGEDNKLRGTFFQIFAAVIANMMAVTDGMCIGWTAPMIPYFLSKKTHIKMTRSEAEWLETFLLVGSVVGLPITMYCVDKIGRRKSLMLSTTGLVICWIVIAVANSIEYLYAARFFQGLGLNMAFVAAPMYVGEISHRKIRGFLSSMVFVLMLCGVLTIYCVAPFVPFFVPSVIAGSLLSIEMVVFIFLPESPYFLLTRGRFDEARESLQRFRDDPEEVESELKEMMESVEKEQKAESLTMKDLFLVKNYRKALIIMFILNTSQLFSCYEVILMNLHEILESAGSIYIEPSLAAIIFATIMLVAGIGVCLTIDKFGRKILMIISSILTGFCLLSLAIYFNLKHSGYDMAAVSWIPIVSVMAYAASFKLGLGMVPIVITAEIFACKIKAIGMTAADGVYVMASIVTLQIFLFLKDDFGMHVPFYIFCCCSFMTSIYVSLCVPETKGKSLDEIQDILRGDGEKVKEVSSLEETTSFIRVKSP